MAQLHYTEPRTGPVHIILQWRIPDFHGGGQDKLIKCPENCMKSRKFWLLGGGGRRRTPGAPPP